MFTYNKEGDSIPVKVWMDEQSYYADPKMIVQVENLSRLPFSFHSVVLMPDGHVGYGMPIGGVLATTKAIIPNAVGVDIGCGMLAMKLESLSEISTDDLKKIMGRIREEIPVGFHRRSEPLPIGIPCPENSIIEKEWRIAGISKGTLGSGNHFIEIQKDNYGHFWIMLHSGSRNLGKTVADYHDKIAVDLNEKWHSPVPKHMELAFLPLDTEEGQAYLRDMDFCVRYAMKNRQAMLDIIVNIVKEVISSWKADPIVYLESIHNYAAIEHHFGRDVWIHRKGAVRAREGDVCIIPGSQGTKSYICRGLGNIHSFQSCSHGAGRKMGRNEAKKRLSLEEEQKRLDDQGIIHGIRGIEDLDEAAGAYKDISWVMEQQQDLVKIEAELSPLAVIKG